MDIPLTQPNQKEESIVTFLWNIILGLGTALTVMGGYIFHRFETAVKKIEDKIAEIEELRATQHHETQKQIATINTNIAVILERIETIMKYIHDIKNQNAVKSHVVDETEIANKKIDDLSQDVKMMQKKMKLQNKKIKKNARK